MYQKSLQNMTNLDFAFCSHERKELLVGNWHHGKWQSNPQFSNNKCGCATCSHIEVFHSTKGSLPEPNNKCQLVTAEWNADSTLFQSKFWQMSCFHFHIEIWFQSIKKLKKICVPCFFGAAELPYPTSCSSGQCQNVLLD
jgi:hypothetical protein